MKISPKETFLIVSVFGVDSIKQFKKKTLKTCKKTTIPIPKHFSFNETLSFLDRGFDECLYNLTHNAVSRLINLSDGKGIIKIYRKGENLEIELQKREVSKYNLQEVSDYVVEWFDLTRNIEPFYRLLEDNPLLSNLAIKYSGSRIISISNLFEAICWAIIGQQITLTFAYKLKRLLVEKYGEKEIIDNQTYLSFPTPKKLVKANRNDLIEMKFSRQKIDYLMNISNAFLDNQISKEILHNCKNKNERIEKLTEIKGVGIWSANYVLMKSIRDMSCITYGDSGLNKAIYTIFKTQKKPTTDEIDIIFKDFKNSESYLNFYLWKSLN